MRNGFKSFSKLKLERNSAASLACSMAFRSGGIRDLLFDEKTYSGEYYRIVRGEGLRICFFLSRGCLKKEKLREVGKEGDETSF